LLPPSEGSRISAFGYPGSSAKPVGEAGFEVHMDARTTQGTVVQVHHQRRDGCKLPFPCYQTDRRIEGGMSGGPVFSEEGRLCGIMCASFDLGDPPDPPISYVATLWPMLAISIDAPSVVHGTGTSYPMYDLARLGRIDCVGLEHVTLEAFSVSGAIVTCPSRYST
jgi:hypothetical protein